MAKCSPQEAAEGRGRMWQSMRILRQFTVADLVATASVRKDEAYVYMQRLADEGYLACIMRGRSAPVPQKAVWKLVRDTGPYAPHGAVKGDPNLDPDLRGTHIRIPKTEYERALKCVRACAGMADPEREIADLKARAS